MKNTISKKNNDLVLSGISLNSPNQLKLLDQFVEYYEYIRFPDEKSEGYRYYYDQENFCYSDAIFLSCFIRHFKPKKIIEIGSGFSSAVMLDTLDQANVKGTELVFIEPYPDRLFRLMTDADHNKCKVHVDFLHNIEKDIFQQFQSGDLLFIDSSHVVKFGSDLQRIFFEILPILPVDSFVHFHDIFHNFEYPDDWLLEGRYWNEAYFLRAFLTDNTNWEVVFFNNYLNTHHPEVIKSKMPLCRKNFGASIYLRKLA